MNYNHLSDSEFLNLLDIEGSNDPKVNRLLKIIVNPIQLEATSELVSLGMNKDTWEMEHEGLYITPAQYIRNLENEIECLTRDNGDLDYELEEAKREIKNLQARPISSLIAELQRELERADDKVSESIRKTKIAQDAEKLAKEKLDMWAIMNR